MLWLAILGCGAEKFTSAAPVDGSEAYWKLMLNHHAVTLARQAPYDTLALIATPQTMAGQPIKDLPVPTYVSQGPSKVAVTPDGVLHAVDAGSEPVWVTATLTVGNVKHTDAVLVRVLDVTHPSVLTTFEIQRPTPPDSAKRAINWWPHPQLAVHATDDQGIPMSDFVMAFRSSNPLAAGIDSVTGEIVPRWPGKVILHASTTVFGVAKADSMPYRIGLPIFAVLFDKNLLTNGLYSTADFPTQTVGVGAVVFWQHLFGDSLGLGSTIEFNDDDLAHIAPATAFREAEKLFLTSQCSISRFDCDNSGNIVTNPPSVMGAARVFTAPGTYEYRCTSCDKGDIGRIVVVDESEP